MLHYNVGVAHCLIDRTHLGFTGFSPLVYCRHIAYCILELDDVHITCDGCHGLFDHRNGQGLETSRSFCYHTELVHLSWLYFLNCVIGFPVFACLVTQETTQLFIQCDLSVLGVLLLRLKCNVTIVCNFVTTVISFIVLCPMWQKINRSFQLWSNWFVLCGQDFIH